MRMPKPIAYIASESQVKRLASALYEIEWRKYASKNNQPTLDDVARSIRVFLEGMNTVCKGSYTSFDMSPPFGYLSEDKESSF